MISKLVVNDMYYFMSSMEYQQHIIFAMLMAIFVGLFFGWLYTYLFLDSRRVKEKREAYMKTLSDKDYRAFLELRQRLK